MLEEVELFVRAGIPKIPAVINQLFVLFLPFLVGHENGGYFTKRRVGQHIVHSISRICQQSVS